MLHLDLFSGIGGFSLAADWTFDNIEHIFCDNEPFAQAVLKKHWPRSYIYDDIRSITADTDSQRLQGRHPSRTAGQSWSGERVDLLTGGFPCQPFSAAGLRRGTADERYLWPEMLRVIRLAKPTWVIAENVRGLTNWNKGLVFEQVCTNLEASGYEVQAFIIPAVAVNAPHRRDRVWFVAHSVSSANGRRAGKDGSSKKTERVPERHQVGKPSQSDTLRNASNTGRVNGPPRRPIDLRPHEQEPIQSNRERFDEATWNENWLEIAAELCSMDDGLPSELDGLKLTKAQHRNAQLKAYGNAIVPQVAAHIMKTMVL